MPRNRQNKSIMFILGSLEPGCDGVGDYTRTLAIECVRRGVDCYLVSICDRESSCNFKEEECHGFKIYRSSILNEGDGYLSLQRLIDKILPDWISLQFVPYSYHFKGIVKQLVSFFGKLSLKSDIHFMFHETWIEFNGDSSWRHYVWGRIQKYYIKKLLKVLKPKLINTSNEFYRNLLVQENIAVDVLPIFSNIRLFDDFNKDDFYNLLSENGLKIDTGNRDEYWVVGLFGSIHKEWDSAPFIDSLAFSARMNGKKLLLVSFGNQGSGEYIWENLKKSEGDSYQCISLGSLSEEKVSLVLSCIDYSISTSMYELSYKSGVVMAYLNHGVPVLFSRFSLADSLELERHPNHDLLIKVTSKSLSSLDSVKRKEAVSWLPFVCDKFMKSIS